MRGQIKSVLTGLSKATVIVTHDQLEALTMADRIAIMRDGVIEQIASPHEVFARPTTLFVASFIGTPQMNLDRAVRWRRGRAWPVHSRRPADPPCRRSGGEETRQGAGARSASGSRLIPDGAGSVDTIAGRAELIEPMGAETIDARTPGSDLRVVVPREIKVKAGDALSLRTDARETHVFDGSGKAVRA